MGCSQSMMAEMPGGDIETDELYEEDVGRKGGRLAVNSKRNAAVVSTPMMERLWRVRPAALQSGSIQTFANLLQLGPMDLKGGVRTFSRISRKGFLDMKRLGDAMELPDAQNSGRVLLEWFFNSVAQTGSIDEPRLAMDFRSFLVSYAMLRNTTQREERLRFWFNVMQASRNPDGMLYDAVPLQEAIKFLVAVLLAKPQTVVGGHKKSSSKILASVRKTLAEVVEFEESGEREEAEELEIVTFAGFVRACVYLNPTLLAAMTDITQRLSRVIKPARLGGNKNEYSQLRIKAYFFNRVSELHNLERKLAGGRSIAGGSVAHKFMHSFEIASRKSSSSNRSALSDISNILRTSSGSSAASRGKLGSRAPPKPQGSLASLELSLVREEVGAAEEDGIAEEDCNNDGCEDRGDESDVSDVPSTINLVERSVREAPTGPATPGVGRTTAEAFEVFAFEKSLTFVEQVTDSGKSQRSMRDLLRGTGSTRILLRAPSAASLGAPPRGEGTVRHLAKILASKKKRETKKATWEQTKTATTHSDGEDDWDVAPDLQLSAFWDSVQAGKSKTESAATDAGWNTTPKRETQMRRDFSSVAAGASDDEEGAQSPQWLLAASSPQWKLNRGGATSVAAVAASPGLAREFAGFDSPKHPARSRRQAEARPADASPGRVCAQPQLGPLRVPGLRTSGGENMRLQSTANSVLSLGASRRSEFSFGSTLQDGMTMPTFMRT